MNAVGRRDADLHVPHPPAFLYQYVAALNLLRVPCGAQATEHLKFRVAEQVIAEAVFGLPVSLRLWAVGADAVNLRVRRFVSEKASE